MGALLALSCVGGSAGDTVPTTPTPSPAGGTITPSQAPTEDASPACPEPCREAPASVGSFKVQRAPEASGLVASSRHDGVLYVLDDGPGTTGVMAISADDARVVALLEIEGLSGTDTEALAAGPCGTGGGDCIYVGDIGDNTRSRATVSVHRFVEPARLGRTTTVPAERIDLRYPDGPHDAEALLVDARGRLGIVTKDAGDDRAGAAGLYTAPSFADATLTDRGRVDLPLPSLPLAASAVGNVVTGGDWGPGRVALRTYDAVFEFRAPSGRGGLRRFPQWPVQEVAVAAEQQGEAVTYGRDGCSLYTVSEGSGALSATLCR